MKQDFTNLMMRKSADAGADWFQCGCTLPDNAPEAFATGYREAEAESKAELESLIEDTFEATLDMTDEQIEVLLNGVGKHIREAVIERMI